MKAIPLWIAVSITVVVALPFGLWLGSWNLPLWLAFIVWAEYFTLGAKPAALKTMYPAFIAGVIGGSFTVFCSLVAGKIFGTASIVTPGDVAWFVGLFVGFIPVIYAMKFMPFVQGPGGLPYFNGISMSLATFFVGSYAAYGGLTLPEGSVWAPVITAIPAILGGLLGGFLGWLNIAIMTPFGQKTASEPAAAEAAVEA